MNFYTGSVTESAAPTLSEIHASDGGAFQRELDGALGKRSGIADNTVDYCCGYQSAFVIISPKIEEKLNSDPEYSEQLSQRLSDILKNQSERLSNSVVIVDKSGEITQHCFSNEREEHPTAEELKEVAKARARKKARLDAYFQLLERVSIKRKLIEQENAKRLVNKKYRFSVSSLDITARSRGITPPPLDPDYFY